MGPYGTHSCAQVHPHCLPTILTLSPWVVQSHCGAQTPIARVSLSVWLHPQIKNLLEREQFDIVHMHEPLVGFVPFSALRHIDTNRTVTVATFHSYRRRRVWWAIGPDRLANRLLNRLHGRIAVSNPAAHFVNSHFPSDYRIIPNGVRVDDFSDAEPLPELMDGKTNILFLGRLGETQGPEVPADGVQPSQVGQT